MGTLSSLGLVALSSWLLAGCGARGLEFDDEPAGVGVTTTTTATTTASDAGSPVQPPLLPIALYVKALESIGSPSSCAEARPVESAVAELAPPEDGDQVSIVEVYYRDECTGAGGHHIIARDIEGFWDAWLGGHACQFFPVPPPAEPQYGVLLYNTTATLFQLPPELCIGFPGEPSGVESTFLPRAIGVFTTREDAEAFAATLPGPP